MKVFESGPDAFSAFRLAGVLGRREDGCHDGIGQRVHRAKPARIVAGAPLPTVGVFYTRARSSVSHAVREKTVLARLNYQARRYGASRPLDGDSF